MRMAFFRVQEEREKEGKINNYSDNLVINQRSSELRTCYVQLERSSLKIIFSSILSDVENCKGEI